MKKINKNFKSSKLIFTISILVVTLCIAYRLFKYYSNIKSLKISNELSDTYKLISTYSNSKNSSTPNFISLNSYQIIGKIEIPKLDIKYPIISYVTYENLKIAPCRFSGPLPNEIGNVCIAGHNYNNNKFFSNISKLNNKDIIKIFDVYDNYVLYEVYSIYEVNDSDLSVLNQNIYNYRELTLVTCNNYNNKRTIVKAKETNYY